MAQHDSNTSFEDAAARAIVELTALALLLLLLGLAAAVVETVRIYAQHSGTVRGRMLWLALALCGAIELGAVLLSQIAPSAALIIASATFAVWALTVVAVDVSGGASLDAHPNELLAPWKLKQAA